MDLEFYKLLLDELYDGVYFVDRDRRILYWNHGAERITGYQQAEIVGHCCTDNMLRHIDDKGRRLCFNGCPLAATIADGAPREVEVYLHHKTGHRVPVRVRVAPIHDASGAITGAVEIFGDNAPRVAMAEQIEELRRLALLDTMTGLANRRYLRMQLQTRLDELRRHGLVFGVLYIDIDHFKQVNDTYGHDIGDAVLKMVATTLQHGLRPLDNLGRWGGEEFLAIVQHTDEAGLAAIADRLRALVEGSELPYESSAVQVTISIGATLGRPGDTEETLLKRADTLLYHSKTSGRNLVSLTIGE